LRHPPDNLSFERNWGCVVRGEADDLNDPSNFTADFLERQSIGIKLVEYVTYMQINTTGGLQTRMERPQAALPFHPSATNGVTCPRGS